MLKCRHLLTKYDISFSPIQYNSVLIIQHFILANELSHEGFKSKILLTNFFTKQQISAKMNDANIMFNTKEHITMFRSLYVMVQNIAHESVFLNVRRNDDKLITSVINYDVVYENTHKISCTWRS